MNRNEDDWCHYSGMPSPKAYEEEKDMNKCKFCGSKELTYHQYIIMDYSCDDCGEWQNGDYINE